MESWTVFARISFGVREKKPLRLSCGAGLGVGLKLVGEAESAPEIEGLDECGPPSTAEVCELELELELECELALRKLRGCRRLYNER